MDLNVELSKQRYDELALKTGDKVFVSPRKCGVHAGIRDLANWYMDHE